MTSNDRVVIRGQGRGAAGLSQKRPPARLTTPIMLLVLTACTGNAPREWRGTIDTLPSGTIHVSNPEQGLWGSRSLWQLAELARIGSRNLGTELFGDAFDIEVDETGRVYVLDRIAHDIRVFEANGSHVRTIGRRGRGPGEFNGVTGIAIDPAGRLWVFNQNNMRYSVFDSAGALLMEPQRRVGIGSAEWYSVFNDAGDLYELLFYRTGTTMETGLVRYDTIAQHLVDTMPVPAVPEGTKLFAGVRTLTADGWWQGIMHTYLVSHIDYAGDTLRMIERSREADPLTASERDSVEQQEEEMQQRVVQGEYDVETTLRPIFQKLLVDDVDHLWVLLAPEPDDTIGRFDVFDPVGRYLGEVTAPHLVEPRPAPVFANGRIYYVTKDELDVQYVVVAEVRGRE
jgi:hypothetical protein